MKLMATKPGAKLHYVREREGEEQIAVCNTRFKLDPETETVTGIVCNNCANALRNSQRS